MGVSDKWGEEMSKYIDAEWIRNVYADFEHYDNRNDWTTPIANVLAVIDDAPSIDIVRCEECKYEPICSHSVQHTTHELTSVTIGYKSVNYCSYGERKDQ